MLFSGLLRHVSKFYNSGLKIYHCKNHVALDFDSVDNSADLDNIPVDHIRRNHHFGDGRIVGEGRHENPR